VGRRWLRPVIILPDSLRVEKFPPSATKLVLGGYHDYVMLVRQPTLAKFVCNCESVSWLVREGFDTTTKNHMQLLYKMTEKAGIHIPEEVKEESLETSMIEDGGRLSPGEAFLPQDEVVTRVASIEFMNRLEKDIMDGVKRENIPSYNFRPKEQEIVLVRAEGETFFSRARVVKMIDSGTVVDVSTTDLAECNVEFVKRLHFQGIRCSLTWGLSRTSGPTRWGKGCST